ncbi:hypothetical protein [Rossellomorea marisflavi]|uniref:hypothetical protein n=1 Tax=Rossellomorea marisflavi TaxID=189381 RepID=UPI0012E890EE|nr:hypothetical protein [Rossellomorea marisflavi]
MKSHWLEAHDVKRRKPLILYMTVEFIKILIALILIAQVAYGFTILLLEKTMLGYYELSIFNPPENWFQKSTNAFQKVTIGSGYYVYTKIGKYNWFVRKVLYLMILILQVVTSIILFQIIALIFEILVPVPL